MKSRKRVPSHLKVLRGNPGKRPINTREPQPEAGASCPEWLDDAARVEWRRVCGEARRQGIATCLDRAILAGKELPAALHGIGRLKESRTTIARGSDTGFPAQLDDGLDRWGLWSPA